MEGVLAYSARDREREREREREGLHSSKNANNNATAAENSKYTKTKPATARDFDRRMINSWCISSGTVGDVSLAPKEKCHPGSISVTIGVQYQNVCTQCGGYYNYRTQNTGYNY